MRQPGGGVCRLRTRIACCTSPEEGSVEQSLSYQARRALLQQTVPQYREASPSQKRTQPDAFVATTGYHRTYARWLLNYAEEVQQTLQRPRPRQYGPEVQHALFLAWNAANRICAKRLIPFLPILADSHPHLRGVEGDPTRLSGSGSRGSLWHRYRGRLSVHLDPHRHSYRVDGVLAPVIPQSGNGAGSSPTGTRTVPFSDPGNRYRQRG
jgi:hypothetical protein